MIAAIQGMTCDCGHPLSDHGHIEGIDLSDGTRLPDVWVCEGVRLADVNAPDWSPRDHVCGCVLHHVPKAPAVE